MRELGFIVKKQYLGKSFKYDFNNIIKGTSNYLVCKFDFDSEWNGFTKAAEFVKKNKPKSRNSTSQGVIEESYGELIKDGMCKIPNEVSGNDIIYMRVIGRKGEQRIVTNFVEIEQEE